MKHRPVMIHRAPFGSIERFMAVLIEHYAGNFPLWMCPDQVIILPIGEKFNEYAKKVSDYLKNADLRTLIDFRDEKIGKKIRDAEVKKIPFMLVVGAKEESEEEVSARKHGFGDLGSFTLEAFLEIFRKDALIN
jgi:threonyl-tRNA synthetase